MGRTLATTSQTILQEERSFGNFRRTLRKSDQHVLDALFASAKQHTAAISQASHALPFETILLTMVLEQKKEIARLKQTVERIDKGMTEQGMRDEG